MENRKETRCSLKLYQGHDSLTYVGYKITLVIEEEWLTHNAKDAEKGFSFDWPFRKTHLHRTLFYTGTDIHNVVVYKAIIQMLVEKHFQKILKLESRKISARFSFELKDLKALLAKIIDLNSYLGNIEPVPAEPIIVKFKEKHGSYHYIAHTREDVMAICYGILKERFKAGYFYDWMKDYKSDTPKPDFTLSDIELMPESLRSEKDNLIKKIQTYEKSLREAEKYRNFYNVIKEAVEKKDGLKAIQILNEQRNSEYEGFEFITIEKIEPII